jgi:hypothetical protein
VRYAVLALIVVGVLGIGVAVDRSKPSRVAVPAIVLQPGTEPGASTPAASPPTLKRAYGGRSLTRRSSPQADRQPLGADQDQSEQPHATTSPTQVPTDAGDDDRREDSAEATGSVADDGTPSDDSDEPKPPQEPEAPETPDTPEAPDTPPAPESPPSPGDPAPTDEDKDEDGGGGSTPTPAPATTPTPATDDDLDDEDDDADDSSDDGSGSSGGGSGDGRSDGRSDGGDEHSDD